MLIKDGPVSIRIDDYIREEKQRLKWERIEKEVKKKEEEKKKEDKEEDFENFMKNFDLKPDKNGKLLNEENMEKIKKIL